MKLYVITRDIVGDMYCGCLKATIKHPTWEIIPETLKFEVFKKISKKSDIPNIKNFMTVNEFRNSGKNIEVKFSQIVLENLGFDRVWIFKDNKI